jgi:hypothetical protein
MNILPVLRENAAVFALLAVLAAIMFLLNFLFVERARGAARPAQSRAGGGAESARTSLLLAANDLLLLLGRDGSGVQFLPPFLDIVAKACNKKTVVTLLVRVKDDAEQEAVTSAVECSPLPAAGFDMRRLLFCESDNCQVPVARQLLPTIFVSAHGPSVAEVQRLEAKRGFVRFCVAVPTEGDASRALEHIASALGVPLSRDKTE